jgi:hypothetical protein
MRSPRITSSVFTLSAVAAPGLMSRTRLVLSFGPPSTRRAKIARGAFEDDPHERVTEHVARNVVVVPSCCAIKAVGDLIRARDLRLDRRETDSETTIHEDRLPR